MDQFDDTGLMSLVCHHDIQGNSKNIPLPSSIRSYLLKLQLAFCTM